MQPTASLSWVTPKPLPNCHYSIITFLTDIKYAIKIPLITCGLCISDQANSFEQHFSQTGFTGILRTPNANTLDYGDISFVINKENNVDTTIGHQFGAHNTFLIGVGLIPGVEFSVQNAWKRFNGRGGYNGGASSDLSFSAKTSINALPWINTWVPSYIPHIALGLQDLEETSKSNTPSFHRNVYVSASQMFFKDLELTLGYGDGHINNQMGRQYLDGLFYGAQWQAHPAIALLGDYDGTGHNLGFNITPLQRWIPKGWTAGIKAQVHSNSSTQNRDNAFISLYLNLPMTTGKVRSPRVAPQTESFHSEEHNQLTKRLTSHQDSYTLSIDSPPPHTTSSSKDISSNITQILENHGFENIKVGSHDGQLAIAIENNVYNWNEIDAIGITLGEISDLYHDDFHVFLLNKKLPVLKIKANGKNMMQFFSGESETLSWHVTQKHINTDYYRTHWSQTINSSTLFPRLTVYPLLLSTLGTEWGVFDYSLAAGLHGSTDLWQGANVDVRYVQRLHTSDDIKNDALFQKHSNGIDQALFNQAFWIQNSLLNRTSIGLVRQDYYGLQHEAQYTFFNQSQLLNLVVAYYENHETSDVATPTLLNYQWLSSRLSWGLELEAGEYWQGDQGVKVRSHHWFGDTRVSFELSDTGSKFAGLYFTFPLTPRKNKPFKHFQLSGESSYIWGYKTRISDANYLSASSAAGAKLQSHLGKQFLNHNRLYKNYLEKHKDRMRGAYMTWKVSDMQ